MKREFKIALFCLLVIIGFFTGLFFVTNSKDVNAEIVNDEIVFESLFDFKSTLRDFDDNWVYNFDILYYKDANKKNYYIFDGYDLKRTYVEGYYIKMINPETQEVVSKTVSDVPTLSRSDKYGDEIIKINDFFNEKQFTEEISATDLKELNLKNVDINLIVNMFNETINSELQTTPGNFIRDSYLKKEILKSDVFNGEWEITYINSYGYIKRVHIDLKYDDGSYLSNKGTYAEEIKEVENYIIENQIIYDEGITKLDIFKNKDIANEITSLLERSNSKVIITKTK